MEYKKIVKGKFISRPNRFIAQVDIDGEVHTVHVKNTGRCGELLIKNATVFLEKSDNPNRKTQYDLVGVIKENRMINMDSQAPNAVFKEYLEKGLFNTELTYIKPEYKYGNSRIDFYATTNDKKLLIEVKGVTLEKDNVVLFPDAPTERGIKHIYELISAQKQGFETYIVFIIQMTDVEYFTPNNETHPQFGKALEYAENSGVKIIALDCNVTENSLEIKGYVPVKIK